jgi:hypothetical protein
MVIGCIIKEQHKSHTQRVELFHDWIVFGAFWLGDVNEILGVSFWVLLYGIICFNQSNYLLIGCCEQTAIL